MDRMPWIVTMFIASIHYVAAVAPSDATTSNRSNSTDSPSPPQTTGFITTDHYTPDALGFISYGFDVFNAELSSSPILDNDFSASDLEAITGSNEYSYDQFKFDYDYDSFSAFVHQDATNIQISYSTSNNEAYGSLSGTRQSVRAAVTMTQYYIYTLRLRLAAQQLSTVAANKLHWNRDFLNNFRILPSEYVGDEDDLDDFKEFWLTYGTHIFKSVELGGIIEGTIVADKCSVSGTFESEEEYLICLNAQYKGYAVDDCAAYGNDFAFKGITASGGETDTFIPVLNAFNDGDKLGAFNNWTNSLSLSNYHVVGGNVDGIWNVIEDAIDLAVPEGNHTLNDYSARTLSDDEWKAIATAMESAFDDYSERLIAEQNSVHDCDVGPINCYGQGMVAEEDCVCVECDSVAECCGLAADGVADKSELSLSAIIVMAITGWCL